MYCGDKNVTGFVTGQHQTVIVDLYKKQTHNEVHRSYLLRQMTPESINKTLKVILNIRTFALLEVDSRGRENKTNVPILKF